MKRRLIRNAPVLFLIGAVVAWYLTALSQTTFYYSGESGVFHIYSRWIAFPFLFFIVIQIFYWILRIALRPRNPGDRGKRLPLRIIAACLLSLIWAAIMVVGGYLLLSLHFSSLYRSEGAYAPDLHLDPVYYLHIPAYILCILAFDHLSGRILTWKRPA
ncbi:MAG: hypothetical protein ACK5MQ_15870 [Pikeienuella sp.]